MWEEVFKGKNIMVTGVGSGIGRLLAITLCKYGANVYGISRTESTLASLKEEYPSIVTICQDLCDWDATKEALDELPVMDGLVNNAAIAICTKFFDVDQEQFDLHMNSNVRSVICISQSVAKKMVDANKPGSIVNVSSIAGIVALDSHTSYGASKAALDQITKIMSLELGPHNIRTNSVNPTVTMTPMSQVGWSDPAVANAMKAKHPIGRFAEPEEVIECILFLLSEKSSMVNGITMPICGGFIAT